MLECWATWSAAADTSASRSMCDRRVTHWFDTRIGGTIQASPTLVVVAGFYQRVAEAGERDASRAPSAIAWNLA